MNNMDMNKLMNMLSKMDKSQIEEGLNQISKMLGSKDADKIIEQIKDKTK